jgi:hypothetical protein
MKGPSWGFVSVATLGQSSQPLVIWKRGKRGMIGPRAIWRISPACHVTAPSRRIDASKIAVTPGLFVRLASLLWHMVAAWRFGGDNLPSGPPGHMEPGLT